MNVPRGLEEPMSPSSQLPVGRNYTPDPSPSPAPRSPARNDSPAPAPPQYHPEHVEPATGWTLQSNDGMCFRIEHAPYVHYSSFFKDISELTPAGEEVILPFPGVSADALKFIVESMNWIFNHAAGRVNLLPKPGPQSFKTYPVATRPVLVSNEVLLVEEIIHFSKAYDIIIVLGPLFEAAKRQNLHPSVIFALCAVRGCGNFSYWATKLVDKGAQDLHPKAVHLLEEHAGEYYSALIEVLKVWEHCFAKFCNELKILPYDSAQKNFSRRCYDRMNGAVPSPCPAVGKFKWDYNAFLADFFPRAIKYARANPQFMGTPAFLSFCDNEVACKHCGRRIGIDVNIAWSKFMLGVSWTLADDPNTWPRMINGVPTIPVLPRTALDHQPTPAWIKRKNRTQALQNLQPVPPYPNSVSPATRALQSAQSAGGPSRIRRNRGAPARRKAHENASCLVM